MVCLYGIHAIHVLLKHAVSLQKDETVVWSVGYFQRLQIQVLRIRHPAGSLGEDSKAVGDALKPFPSIAPSHMG